MPIEVKKSDETIQIVDADLDTIVDGAPDTVYTIRSLPPEKVIEIRRPYVTHEFNKRTHRKEEIPMTEEQQLQYGLDLLDYTLVEWKGVNHQGKPLPCVRENKALLDAVRRNALLGAAGLNQTRAQAVREESFREPPGVLPVLGG